MITLAIDKVNNAAMKAIRAILSGAIVWLCIFTTFAVLGFVPGVKDAPGVQVLIVAILTVPFAITGAAVYYRGGRKENGIRVGVTMAATALGLDALITVPLVAIPHGQSYLDFFTYPPLWLLVALCIATVYAVWRFKILKKGEEFLTN